MTTTTEQIPTEQQQARGRDALSRRLAERVAAEHDVERQAAGRYVEAMLQFLDVCSRSERALAPSPPIDAAWHAFILHTRDYARYCEERFGRFLHHQPTAAGEGDADAYPRARRLAAERFGALDELAWPEPSAGADCGSCEKGKCEAGKCEAGKCEGAPAS